MMAQNGARTYRNHRASGARVTICHHGASDARVYLYTTASQQYGICARCSSRLGHGVAVVYHVRLWYVRIAVFSRASSRHDAH